MFDTSVFSPYRKRIDKFIPVSKFSLVVFYELAATNIDDGTIQKLEMWKNTLSKVNSLITPTQTDWINAAKSIRRLRKLKLIDKNMPATILQNDALIARSAYTHDCFVVTENVKDFTLLQKVMPKLEVIPAKEFFS
ncbi:MAG: type II toxin-antitoxin system VapC family toxin [Pyrinomonadaceae bacterium]